MMHTTRSQMLQYMKTIKFDDYDDIMSALDKAGISYHQSIDMGMGAHLSINVDGPAILQLWHPNYNAGGENFWVIVFGVSADYDTGQDDIDGDASMDIIVAAVKNTLVKIAA